MSLQNTASADRIHIGIFGKRNAGKSSLINAITGQSLSIVSHTAGTTTDPVSKAMELLPIGPVVIIDTPGFDDEGELGSMRVAKTRQMLAKTDIAILVTDGTTEPDQQETAFASELEQRGIPHIIVRNKADIAGSLPSLPQNQMWVSALNQTNINQLKEKIAQLAKQKTTNRRIIADLLKTGDTVVLVTPIDESAPKGRLILPQQQTIRDILDAGCTAIVCKETELGTTLSNLAKPPKMVVTDSQVFGKVAKLVPNGIPLTSFSILFARYKGDLTTLVKGAAMLSKLCNGDKVLISEGCTHHRQCGDIGTVKLPAWIKDFSSADVAFDFTSGGEFPTDLSQYKLVVHCGGCMLNQAEMSHRISTAVDAGIPIVNYGVAIAHINGILKRSLELFPDVANLLD